jgi:CDGSH-type Zn-finger protein
MKSKEFPFCDGIHKTLEGNPAGPVVVEVAPLQDGKTG